MLFSDEPMTLDSALGADVKRFVAPYRIFSAFSAFFWCDIFAVMGIWGDFDDKCCIKRLFLKLFF